MFKKNIFKYILVLFASAFIFLVGCKGANPIVSIQVENQSEENPIVFVVGEFSYEELSLVVEYESGEKKVVSITEEMINKDDLVKLYKLGKNEIEVSYEKNKTSMFIFGTYKQFENLYLNDVTTTYTGQEFKVEVEGNIPETAQIIYPQGNTYKNAGSYVTKAIIFENGYEVLELSANVIINKAEYDMSLVEFEDFEYTYDGKEKMIYVQGPLPEGVSVSYYINGLATTGMIDSGVYEVTASFKGDSSNYKPIESKKATLTISKATYNMEGIRLEDAEFTYDGSEHELTLTNEYLLPQGVTPVYKNNKQTDAGEYEVVVEFELGDISNYNAIKPYTATMKINKAEYDLSQFTVSSRKQPYSEGTYYQLSIDQELPNFIKAEYKYFSLKGTGVWNSLSIDATNGYWYRNASNCISIGKGTVITVDVANKTQVSITAQKSESNFEISVENGKAKIVCLNDDEISDITCLDPENPSIFTIIDLTTCDVIFGNKDIPLPSNVFPSSKGEYLVVVKLVVEDPNYYGEEELTAFLIIE